MAKYGDNGWPVGTVVQIVDSPSKNWIDKKVIVVKQRYFCEKFEDWMYDVDFWGNIQPVRERQLRFCSYEHKMQNWARNRVSLLQEFNQEVFNQLVLEKELGELK